MKNSYLEPILEVVKFAQEDILATSAVGPTRESGFMESEEIPLD